MGPRIREDNGGVGAVLEPPLRGRLAGRRMTWGEDGWAQNDMRGSGLGIGGVEEGIKSLVLEGPH